VSYRDYYNYLLRRSRLGYLYRRYFLYPFLNQYLSGTVLDFGCGIGDFLSFRSDTIGVDVNPFVITHCRRLGLQAYHIEQLPTPFQDMTFQGALLDNVLEHLDQPETVLKEIVRVLSHNATLIIGVPGKKGYDTDPDSALHGCKPGTCRFDFQDLIAFLASIVFMEFFSGLKMVCKLCLHLQCF